MKFNYLFYLVFLFVLINVSNAADYGPITMREGANITLDGGFIKNFQSDSVYNPRAYGAAVDGVTDDSAALLAALQNASPGGAVILPPGTMKIDSACDPTTWENVSIVGSGSRTSKIKLGADITLFSPNKTCAMQGFSVIVPSANTNPVMNFSADHNLSDVQNIDITGTAANGTWDGIKISGHGFGSHFGNVNIRYPGIGLNLTPTNATIGIAVTDLVIDNIHIWAPTYGGVLMDSSIVGVAGNTFDNIHIIGWATTGPMYGVKMTGSTTQANQIYGLTTWCDGVAPFTAIDLGTGTFDNQIIGGHVEGMINDSGEGNLIDMVNYRYSNGHASSEYPTGWMLLGLQSNRGSRNVIQNGDFDSLTGSTPDFWGFAGANAIVTDEESIVKSGSHALKLAGNSGAGDTSIAAIVPRNLIISDVITLGAWVRSNSTNSGTPPVMELSDISYSVQEYSAAALADGQWHFLQVSANVADTTDDIRVVLYTTTTASSDDVAYFDGVVLVDGPIAPQSYVPFQAQDNSITSGTATITAGQTSVSVSHGHTIGGYAGVVPTRVFLTPTTDTGGKRWWISAKAATTFSVSIDSSHGSDISFDWIAMSSP